MIVDGDTGRLKVGIGLRGWIACMVVVFYFM